MPSLFSVLIRDKARVLRSGNLLLPNVFLSQQVVAYKELSAQFQCYLSWVIHANPVNFVSFNTG